MKAAQLSAFAIIVGFAIGCGAAAKPVAAPIYRPSPQPLAPSKLAVTLAAPEREVLSADSTRSTAQGTATFTVPAGWSIAATDAITRLYPAQGEGQIALVDMDASEPDAATKAAWQRFRSDFDRPVLFAIDPAARNGWERNRTYDYQVAPNEKVTAQAVALRFGARTVSLLIEWPTATHEKRLAQLIQILDSLMPTGYRRESFAGRKANVLDSARLQQLDALVELGQRELGIPGAAIAVVQDGKLIHSRGFGVRALGKPAKVDPDTLFMVASSTKALTTLLLAQLVDDGKLRWDMPVTEAFPGFKLGGADTTQRTQIKHLVCACTGLPRNDFEWLFEYDQKTPVQVVEGLARVEPTSKFGEIFQYSNQLAASAGYVAAHVAYPDLELGAAYDRAMATRVFGPLGMRSTTFDFARALRAQHAVAHSWNIDGQIVVSDMAINRSAIATRPSGGAWSSARDMIRYVQLELDRGLVPGSKRRIVSEANLLERRVPSVSIGEHETYGMGLEVDTTYDVPVVHTGGRLFGFKNEAIWLPDHGVGAVILTNSDASNILLNAFQRALLEQLFDGKPEATEEITAAGASNREWLAKERSKLTFPPDPQVVVALAPRYLEPSLGAFAIRTSHGVTTLDVGEWQSQLASQRNDDGTFSLITVSPGFSGATFVVGTAVDGKRQLTLRDSQHEYALLEAPAE